MQNLAKGTKDSFSVSCFTFDSRHVGDNQVLKGIITNNLIHNDYGNTFRPTNFHFKFYVL